ncbi:MAG: hypothetical protein AAB384_04535 [Patescibacteria group bacterium]
MIRMVLGLASVGVFSSLVVVSNNPMSLRSLLVVFPTTSQAALVVCVRASGQLGLRWSAPLYVNGRACDPSASFTPLATPEPLICADIMPEQLGCAGSPGTVRLDGAVLPMPMQGQPLLVFARDTHGALSTTVVTPDDASTWTFAAP